MKPTASVGIAVLFGALFIVSPAVAANSKSPFEVVAPSTPPGITLQSVGKFAGYSMDTGVAALSSRGTIVLADARGMTLYTYGKDKPGRSQCIDECAKTWMPLVPVSGSKPIGPWSIINRPDGTRQWSLSGRPLYTYIKDVDPGAVGGNSPKRFAPGSPNVGERGSIIGPIPADVPLPPDWSAAYFYPSPGAKSLPPDFDVRYVQDVFGLVLVDHRQQTLYVFDGSVESDRAVCSSPCAWKPLRAPELARSIGDFSPISRADGQHQWSYKGRGLYTYDGDLAPGDANGSDVSSHWQPTYFSRNFMPRGVAIQNNPRLGRVLSDARGRTLYRRDSYYFQSGSGHQLRRGAPIRSAVGRQIGINAKCVRECEKWHPFLAPADAMPQGDWTIYVRADGSKQWGYIGFALWTYDGDAKPGDVTADEEWDLYNDVLSPSQAPIDIGTWYDTVAGLYWGVVVP